MCLLREIMNNNYGNENQNQNGYSSNNNNWNNQNWNNQNYPGYGNNFNPNYGNNNYNLNMADGQQVAKKCKSLAIAYLCLILIMIVAAVLAGVFAGMEVTSAIDTYYSAYDYSNNSIDSSSSAGYDIASMVMIIIMVVAIVSFEIIAIVLIVKTNTLKTYYPQNGALWILYLIGLFIGITGIVGSFMTISACRKIERLSADGYYQSQNPSQAGPRY